MEGSLKNRPDILKLVENVAIEQGIRKFRISGVETNPKGEGYLSQIFLVTIADAASDRKLEVAVKASFNDEKNKSSVALYNCGENEIYFYSKVYETFKKFQQKRGVEEEINFFPRCYKTFLNSEHQLLCLENLRKVNFEVIDKRQVLDHDHISLIFKTYGKFHAFSYALRDQEPEKFSELTDGLQNMYLQFVEDKVVGFAKMLKVFANLAYEYLIPGKDDKIIRKFEKYINGGIITSMINITTEKEDSFCITHGDCWSNNMMFKYEETNNVKTLVDLRLLDLQFAKLGSPVCDLSYCLYSGCSKKILDNLNQYLDLYYKSFSSFLRKLGSDPEKLFPFETLKEHWKKYAKFGMFMALMVLRMKVTKQEEIVDFTDGLEPDDLVEKFLKSTYDKETYQTQIRDLLQHTYDFDVL